MKASNVLSLKRLWLVTTLLLTLSLPSLTSCKSTTTAQSTDLVATTQLVPQAEYPELPPLRPGAIYSPRLENVRRIALEDEANDAIPAGSYQKVTALLTSANIFYQTDPNGNDVACIPMIAAMIDRDATYKSTAEMQHIFDEAYQDGLAFTPKLFDIALANHLYLDGLENAVKAASHIVDKANRRAKSKGSELTQEEIAADLNDLVRYSAIIDKEHYVDATLALISALESNGYEVIEIDNRFLGKDGHEDLTLPYRAIHLGVKDGNRIIEIQVHDHSSQAIRESTHEIYEHMRQLDKQSDEYRRLDQQRLDAWSTYQNPIGIERIQSRFPQ